jgi:predicted ATP-grasp superfamily ATP-dependent carboligase
MATDTRSLALLTQPKIRRYPTDFGNAAVIESVRAAAAEALGAWRLERLHYRGIVSIEFKRDARTGDLQLIEVKTPLGRKNILAARCGASLLSDPVSHVPRGPAR